MSIDKNTMKIFFEGMEGSFLGSGYSSKIILTPMGPFKWNSVMELWENVNNGMVMNNISFQDMMVMGYETNSGDNGDLIGSTCFEHGFTVPTVPNYYIGYSSADQWVFMPSVRRRSTNTCPFTLYFDVENFVSNDLTIDDFTFLHKNTVSSDSGGDPLGEGSPYVPTTLGVNGTNIEILPGTTIGVGTDVSPSKVAITFRKSDGDAPAIFGTARFQLKIYNKNSNQVIATTGVTFTNISYDVIRFPTASINLQGITTSNANNIMWAGETFPQTNVALGRNTILGNISPSILLTINSSQINVNPSTATNLTEFHYSLNGGPVTQYTGAITITDQSSIKIGARFPATAFAGNVTGSIQVRNMSASPSQLIMQIPWSYNIDNAPEPPPEPPA